MPAPKNRHPSLLFFPLILLRSFAFPQSVSTCLALPLTTRLRVTNRILTTTITPDAPIMLSGRGESEVSTQTLGLRGTRPMAIPTPPNAPSENGQDMEFWWNDLCNTHHKGRCPPFELVTFTLSPSPVSHPTSPPCTALTQAARACAGPRGAGTWSRPRACARAGGQLTRLRALLLQRGMGFLTPASACPLPVPLQTRKWPPPGDAHALRHTHTAAVTPAGPDPDADPERGVAVFYPSHATALAAARRLGMEDAKIMVSSNATKLEAWMLGKSFEGEDD
ncbi:hypothetical protein B0H14DRAFT_2556750 [Mycena olivaceomarginata]|nr:hypothetical protein B0H14DRAFT_2556750 [Mycena olivaceomarginata]